MLKKDYENLEKYELVMISKVFTSSKVPDGVLELPNVHYGGTGFYYENAPPLAAEIEHIKPDYDLYNDWVQEKIKNEGCKPSEFKYYTDYSIGFLTRGCFRQCEFCVNKNKKVCEKHSDIREFLDESRPKLCFLDDNFFACKEWQSIIASVRKTGKKFQFKQGLDERLLDDEKIHELVSWNYDGDYIFAFDDIRDRCVIEAKLMRWFELHPEFNKRIKFYILCGYDRDHQYTLDFWRDDIISVFERCVILAKYMVLPYLMRHSNYESSPFRQMYVALAMWANQPSFFKKTSFRVFCKMRGMSNKNYQRYKLDFEQYISDGHRKGSCWRAMEDFEEKYPDVAAKFFDLVPDNITQYWMS